MLRRSLLLLVAVFSIAVVGSLAWLSLFGSLRASLRSRTIAIDGEHLFANEAEHDPRRLAGPVPIAWLRAQRGFFGTGTIREGHGHVLVLPRAKYAEMRTGLAKTSQRKVQDHERT